MSGAAPPLRSLLLLLGAGGAGATPQSRLPPLQPSSPEKLVQLFCNAANSFFLFFGGCPRPRGPWVAGVAPGAGWGPWWSPPAAGCAHSPGKRRAPPAAGRNLGQRSVPRAPLSFGSRRGERRWGGDARHNPFGLPAV